MVWVSADWPGITVRSEKESLRLDRNDLKVGRGGFVARRNFSADFAK